jgi:conjugal transfer pilus assembly protein TraB
MGVLDRLKSEQKGKAFNIDPNASSKRKQVVILLLIAAGLLGIGLWVSQSSKSEAPQDNKTKTGEVQKNFKGLETAPDNKNIWMATGIKKIEELAAKQKMLEAQILDKDAEIENRIKKAVQDSEIKPSEGTQPDYNKSIDDLRLQIESLKKELAESKEKKSQEKPAPSTGLVTPSTDKKPIVVKNRFFSPDDLKKNYVRESEILSEKEKKPAQFKTTILTAKKPGSNEDSTSKRVFKNYKTYTPAGTFFPALLLGGIDAATGGQAQENPQPIFMEIDNVASLPGNRKFNMKTCRLIAHAYGDLSSERVFGRLETMSCIDHAGNVYERTVKGHIYGEDGKVGMRGRLKSKESDLLMKSLIAGVASGIGVAFQKQATNYSTSALGTVATFDPDKIGMAGLGEGVNNALDRLSQYYIDLAEKLFPILEVDAGRLIDVMLAKGIDWLEEEDYDNQNASRSNAVQTVDKAMSMVSSGQNQSAPYMGTR